MGRATNQTNTYPTYAPNIFKDICKICQHTFVEP